MRVYRAWLHLYPASFRNEYGAEMCAIFARRLREAGPAGRVLVWLDAVVDVILNAARVQAEHTLHDARYAVRTLVRVPAFSVTAILVAALGIGAATAAFSITDHVLMRPLPFEDPDRLVRLRHTSTRTGGTNQLSPANFRDWQRMATGFETLGVYSDVSANLVGSGEPQRLTGARVTKEIFPMLGVAPALGRPFEPADDAAGAPGTVVLSHALWQERFGGDPGVLGRRVLLDDEPYEVIGVMPRTFQFPSREVTFWTPARFGPRDFEDRGNTYLHGLARLRDGMTIEGAGAQLSSVAAQLEREYPRDNQYVGATVLDLRVDLTNQSRLLLVALFGASGCVLLIACTNLANLLLARALTRRRELAVRAAIGAGRERLIRQMLTESLVVAGLGGALGVALAVYATPVAARLVPNALPIAEVPGVDVRMLLFAAAVTLATGIGFGMLPAVRAGRVDTAALAEGGRAGISRRAERLRSSLVVAEVTASVVLLVATGLLIRALWTVQQTELGFDPDGVMTLRTTLPWPKYEMTEPRLQFYRSVLSEVRALPGVEDAAYISHLPMGAYRAGIWGLSIDTRAVDRSKMHAASMRIVTPGFFRALRIPLIAGRDVEERDTRTSPLVAIVSESLVKQLSPSAPPLGRRLFVGPFDPIIVGIVGDIRVRGLERRSEPQVYLAYAQQPDRSVINYTPKDLVIRSTAPPGSLIPAVRAIVAKTDPRQPISDIRSMEEVVGVDLAPRTAQLRVLGAFAAVALLLAGIGLHGLLAFSVSARTREIGVRIALGAHRRDIVRMVAARALVLAGVGAVLGGALAVAAGRSLQALLAGVSPADASALAATCGLVLLATVLGTVAPARRAMRIDPLEAIRAE